MNMERQVLDEEDSKYIIDSDYEVVVDQVAKEATKKLDGDIRISPSHKQDGLFQTHQWQEDER